jgi:hypothetical protein
MQTAPSLDRMKAPIANNVGKGWFNIEPAVMTEDLKRDIKIIQMRNYLDSKRYFCSILSFFFLDSTKNLSNSLVLYSEI